ncbi:hypothetical protein C5167_028043, partial [Papaver somniferum]
MFVALYLSAKMKKEISNKISYACYVLQMLRVHCPIFVVLINKKHGSYSGFDRFDTGNLFYGKKVAGIEYKSVRSIV